MSAICTFIYYSQYTCLILYIIKFINTSQPLLTFHYIYHSLVAQAKNLQPAVVFLPLRLQDQNSLPVLGPGLYTCRRRVRRPHPHSGGVPSAWHEPGEAASSCGLQ